MTRCPLSTEAEFQQLMAGVDRQLQTEMVPIPSRPMKAESILAVQLGEPFVHPYPKREPAEGRYTGDDLTIRVSRWFKARYGNRLKMYFGPGRMVIMVLRDPWLVRFPMLTGTWSLFLSATEPSDPSGRVRRAGEPFVPMRFNIAGSFVDLPPELVMHLSDRQAEKIMTTWRNGFMALTDLNDVQRRHELVPLATADWDAAVDHLTADRGELGLARWGSLQAVEKMLKVYISLRASTYKRSHELAGLADDAEKLGLAPIDRTWLALVQCSPGVRYGTEQVTLDAAVTAHHAALGMSAHVARSISAIPANEGAS
jgi:hypothetical protein